MNRPATNSPAGVTILGSTGSIGCSTLEVLAALNGRFFPFALSAHGNLSLLVEQARQFKPKYVVASDPAAAAQCDWSRLPPETELLLGPKGIAQIASHPQIQIVVAAIVGSAGLRGTWAAVEAGKRVALANKETLVMAGPLVMRLARERGAEIIPVDSEHSAIFQALQCGGREEVARIILTASGGPFRTRGIESFDSITVAEALAHPTWEMGAKISIDSATMMNKALEIVEARWLFDLPAEQIAVVVHPQSVVHSLVEYVDGSVIAQLGPPDMRLPIQYALTWPERLPGPARRLNIEQSFQFDFSPPDPKRFPAVELGLEVARQGGTAGAVVNAANEMAVREFLEGRLQFTKIVPACRAVLERHRFENQPTLDRLTELDAWAREEVLRWMRG